MIGRMVTSPVPSHLKPLAIGGISVNVPVVLAPMSGVTDAPFRKLAAELGAGLVVSEMTASDDLAKGRPIARLRCEASGIGPHVVQLAGCETQWMAEGARIAEAAGADIIDINMGCPARHVTNGEAGSALMRDLDHALRLIDATVGAVSVPVTLKMRLGWDHQFDQRAGTGAARGSGRRQADHRARPHALPVLQGAGGLERRFARSGMRSRSRWSSTATSCRSRMRARRWRNRAPTR